MKKRKQTALLILFVVVSAVTSGLLWQSKSEISSFEQQVEELRSELNKETAINEQMRALLALDSELLFASDYNDVEQALTEALHNYDSTLIQPIQRRLDFIASLNETSSADNDTIDERDQVVRRQRIMLQAFQSQMDSLRADHWQRADSLKSLIAKAHEDIRKKDKELQKKQRVQVISFAGNNGATIHYLGEVVEGKANGGGVGIWSTGSLYRGEWRNNLRHGKGSFEWVDGEKYNGEYIDGKREGDGTYTWPSGERYEGQWMNDRRNGEGILYDVDGNKRYEGAWKDDKPLN